jgi:hypothetical protein
MTKPKSGSPRVEITEQPVMSPDGARAARLKLGKSEAEIAAAAGVTEEASPGRPHPDDRPQDRHGLAAPSC